MGHDHHFLSRLDRAPREQMDLALSLYRDADLVRHLLLRAELPPDQPRMALSLGDRENGPFLVLARDGHFVTCLGAGMRPTGLHVRTREWLEEVAGGWGELQSRIARARAVTGAAGGIGALLSALYVRAHMFPREDFRALAAVAPIMGPRLVESIVLAVRYMGNVRPRLATLRSARSERERTLVQEYWRSLWGAANSLLLLSCAGDAMLGRVMDVQGHGSLTSTFAVSGVSAIALRAARFAAALGEPAIPFYVDAFSTGQEMNEIVDAAFALNALAGKSPAFAVRARGGLAEARDRTKDAGDPLSQFRHALASMLLAQSVDEYVSVMEEAGRELLMKRCGLTSEETIPDSLARTATLNMHWDCVTDSDGFSVTAVSAALAGRVSIDEFFFTEEFHRKYPVDVSVDRMLGLVHRRTEATLPKPATVRNPAQPGRNGPCSCGSGVKFKRCCGK